MLWKWFLMLGSLTCLIIGFIEAGGEGLLWVVMGWMLRIEFIIQKHREEVEEEE